MVAIITGFGNGLERSSLSVLGSAGKIGNAQLGRGGQNVYVNAATGTLNIQRQDEFLVGRGPDADLASEFSTGSQYWHSPKWSCVYGLTGTVNTAGSTITRLTAYYDFITYTYDAASGAYLNKQDGGAHDEVRFAGGVWSFTEGNSRKVEYYEQNWNGMFLVSRVLDTDGNAQTYTYDASGVAITRITNADGSFVEMTNTLNRPNEIKTSYINASGGLSTMTRVRYTWDAAIMGRLNALTVDLTPHDNSIADGNVYRIDYGYSGSTQRLTSITQTDGSRLDIAYDASGRVISYTETISAGVTRTTTLSYETDAQGNKFTRVRDAQLQDTLLYYDVKGQLTKTVSPAPVAGAGTATVSYAYNTDGDVVSVTDALGNTTTFTYDSKGNVLTETDSFGNSVTRTYGAKNELLRETRWGSHAAAAEALLTTRYAYDSENHLRYVITPKGYVTEYRYTAAGDVEYEIEYPEHAYPSANYAPEVLLSEAQLNAWRDSLADRNSTKITYNTYDARGQLATSTRYGIATAAGAASTAEGYGRTTYVYDQSGRLLSRMNEGQSAEAFLYDGMGRMIGATDLNGGTTSIAFNDVGTQTVVTLANGFVQTSTYNKAGDLLSYAESGSYVAGGTSTHKYDKLGRLRMTTDATGFKTYHLYDKRGRQVADINHNGYLTEYRYDANNRLIATIRYANAVNSGYFASLADPDSTIELATIRPAYFSADVSSFIFYDKEGRVTATVDGSGSVQSHEYNKGGERVKTVSYYNKLASSQINAFKSNTPLTVTLPAADARDSVARKFYDREGKLLGVLDGEGYLTRITFDQAGQTIAETSWLTPTNAAYRASGTLNDLYSTTPAHADDRRTNYVYDGRGLLRFVVDGMNQVTEFGYDSAGQRTSTIRYAGAIAATTDYTYDNIKALVTASGLGAAAQTRRSWSVYDAAGRLAFSVDSEDAVTRFVYDNRGQVTKTVQYAAKRTGTTSLPSYATMNSWAVSNDGNAANRLTRHYYSARGERRFTVDAEGYVSRTDFDAAGRAIREVRWDAALAGVHDGWTIDTVNAYAGGTFADTRYGYNSGGALTDVWDGENNWTFYSYNATGTLAGKWVIGNDSSPVHYAYDGAGRVIAEYRASGSPEAATTLYSYDGHGNLISVTDPRGNVTTRTYDKLGRMLTETTADGTVTHQYNAFGDAVKTTDARGNSAYNYFDRLGRLTAIRDNENYVTETGYNVFGDILSVVRRYNRANNAASVSAPPTYVAHAQDATTTFEYDRLGRATKTTDAEGHYEQYTLDAYGNRTSVRNRIGGVTTNVFDRRGRLVAETVPMASYDNLGNVVAWTVTNRFQYDARGNRTKKIEADGLAEKRITTYVYDKADRLVETQGDAVSVLSQSDHASSSSVVPTEKYKYDANGRLIETIDALGGRTLFYYDKLNRKTVEIGANGSYTAYTYDKNGNVLTTRRYGTAVALPGAAGGTAPAAPGGEYRETSNTYDALNRLKTSSVANVRTGAWNGSYYATGVGTVTTTFDYDSNGNLIKTTDAGGGTTFAFYDKANRKIAHVDAENYLTFNTLDGEGNVTQEERLATKLAGVVTTSSDPTALRNSVAGNAADRITQFGYDRNGRRTSEWRLYIHSHTVGSNGALGTGGTHGGIHYFYNGLGQIWQKSFGNDDYVSYVYDASGRLTQESRSPYTDQNGATVRPTTFYYYNGVNNLTLSRQGGMAQAAGDRLTRYTYGAGGRMTSMIDAAGNTYQYFHDAAGNVLRENYQRTKSDGISVTEGLLYNRDILGRVTSRALATWAGYWARSDSEDTEYNLHGDVSRRGVNGLWQEQFAYDGAGRIWRSNSGDGVWRFFVHDGNGNQTLTIESEGANLAGYSIDQALSAATAGGAYHPGGAYIDGVNVTINVFDKRGQAVQSRMPQRQLNDTSAATAINVSRTYTAFGEVASETDARGFTTDYFYNTMGRAIEKRSPTVNYTTESGAVGSARPTEYYYYDRAGRLIGSRDANGNLTTRALLAGTGHDGSEALVTYEYHADGGYLRNDYDVFGDRRSSWDEINRRTDMVYDSMGRVTQITRPNGLIDYFGYDQLGQKTSHWNNFLQTPIYGPPQQVWVEEGYWDNYYGWVDTSHWETHTPIVGYAPDKELTDYDLQGRVTRQVAFGGDTTTTSYSWNGAIATNGMGIFGGWTETTTMANGRSSTEQTDVFGRQVYRSDLGGHVYTFSYDLAGRMTQRAGTETLTYTWLNTGKLAQSFSSTGVYGSQQWSRKGTTYGYDANGNLTSEYFADEGHSYYEYWDPYYGYQSSNYVWSTVSKNATASYDALNRMATWAEAGGGAMASASTAFEYDLTGNIRRSNTTYRGLQYNGTQTTTNLTQDNWYRFDSMNRLVTKGSLVGGQIVRGYGGADYLYDKAGQRVSATLTTQGEAYIYDPYGWDPYYGGNQYMLVYYDAETREDYSYDAGGVLTSVRVAQGGYTDNFDGTLTVHAAPAYAQLRASYTNDLMGRVTRQIDWLGDGANAAYDRTVTLNAKGQVTNETVVNKQGSDTITTYSVHDFGSGSNYALGAVVYSSSTAYKNNSYSSASSTTNAYIWFEGALQSTISTTTTTYTPSYSSSTHTTTLTYDGSGSLSSIYVGDGRPRSITFVNDANGQTIKRDESDNNWNQYTGGDPHEIWHRFGGKQMGYVGNNGSLETDYATSITNRTRAPGNGAFRFGVSYGEMKANFDLSNEAITSYSQGVVAGGYTARQGDSLESIAASLWGDSSLWYKLAAANGMTSPNGISEGQRLTIPAGVMKSHHNASTFRPFDPSETLGDISPTTPQPQKVAAKRGGKCGVFGQILLVVIAVAVSAITYGALTGPATGLLGAIGAGAVSGAAGSIASQAVGVATGIQDKFSWKGVAMAAITGAVGGGLGKFAQLAKAGQITGSLGKVGTFLSGSGFVSNAVRGALGSAITQGIGVATGLQKKFDFVGVAVAGIAAGVSSIAARHLADAGLGVRPELVNGNTVKDLGYYANQLVSGMAGSIAGAATKSVLDGSDFGDNVISSLPNVIGTTIGNMIADPVVAKIGERRQREADERARSQHEALLKKLAAIAASRDAPENRFGGARLMLASGQVGFGEPDPFQDIRDRYSLEGVVTTIGEGVRERGQDAFTSVFSTALRLQLEAIKLWPGTTDLATQIIDRFTSDSSERVFVFDSRTEGGRAAWQELLTTGPSDFFMSYLNNALELLAARSGNELVGTNWVLREGASVTGVRANNLLTPVNRALGTDWWRGDMLDWGDLSNGAQLGDVVGTMSSGMNARVENNMVIFEAQNSTTLTSAAYGNLFGAPFSPFMNMPTSGPYSPVIQQFRLEIPISDINNAVYRPRR